MTFRIFLTVLASFFVLGGGGYAGYTYFTKPKPQTYIICESDIKPCKDGIGVGRISPSCEFALCPEERPEGNGGIKVLSGKPISGEYVGTFESIRENGGDYQCTLRGESATGTIYASQGELRADFEPVMKPNIRSVATHLILAKTRTYGWADRAGSAVSFLRGMIGGDALVSGVLPVDPLLPHTFDCMVWMRDAEKFTPPSSVEFKDYSAVEATSTEVSS